ncbi:hypothetical protein [Dyadobacter diqingensis]|uniref:hypothetical protein n=1 Tax=Dyadobacter diqingensis TaxID=2938121 RepID=UPI0020C1A6E7|nr:hypothetical protein [Dyadobacter diqingensis]
MKTIIDLYKPGNFSLRVKCCCLILIGLISCSKDEEQETVPDVVTACRLLKVSYSTIGAGYLSNDYTATSEYNAENQLFRVVNNTKAKANNGSETNNVSTITYEYDANGFVTNEKKDANENNATRTENNSSTVQYGYKDGKLVTESRVSIYKTTYKDSGKTETYTYNELLTFEYDSNGRLSKLISKNTSSSGGQSVSTRLYSNGKITRILYQGGSDPEEDYYTISDGKIIQYKNGDNLQIYKYDGQNRLVKTEAWSAGKLTSYIDQGYDNQKVPVETSPELFFKGWPREKILTGEYGNVSNNITSVKISTVKATGTTEDANYSFRYEFNSRGIPVKAALSGTYSGRSLAGEYRYDYINCN